jgi:hypothetical protein
MSPGPKWARDEAARTTSTFLWSGAMSPSLLFPEPSNEKAPTMVRRGFLVGLTQPYSAATGTGSGTALVTLLPHSA